MWQYFLSTCVFVFCAGHPGFDGSNLSINGDILASRAILGTDSFALASPHCLLCMCVTVSAGIFTEQCDLLYMTNWFLAYMLTCVAPFIGLPCRLTWENLSLALESGYVIFFIQLYKNDLFDRQVVHMWQRSLSQYISKPILCSDMKWTEVPDNKSHRMLSPITCFL